VTAAGWPCVLRRLRSGLAAAATALGAVLSLALLFVGTVAHAHQLRPAILSVEVVDGTTLQVQWVASVDTPHPYLTVEETGDDLDVSILTGRRLRDIRPILPEGCEADGSATVTVVDMERRWSWRMQCVPEALESVTLGVTGLETARADALVRFVPPDGVMRTASLRAGQPTVTWTLSHANAWMARWGVAVTYLLLGVEHILLGPDHLIFVLLLVLLVRSPSLLLATITGFTVGHSVTLVMAVMGVVNVPGPPVEALIALSIVQLASEVVVQNDTGDAAVARRPWLVSSVFGLLHGLGFAGALAETGLPSTGLPLALATFNVGVELGQLLFVAVVLGLMWLTPRRRRAGVATAMAWLAGLVAGYWLVERTVALLG